MLASSGYVARVDENLCLSCGDCEMVCHFDALQINLIAEVDEDKCMGCGLCANQCQSGAIQLSRMVSKGEPLEIQELIEAFRKSETEKISSRDGS